MGSEKVAVMAVVAINCLALSWLERRTPGTGPPGGGREGRLRPNLVLALILVAVNLGLDRAVRAAGLSPSTAGGTAVLSPLGLPAWAQVLAVVVVLDGLAYLAHVLLHALPAAWRMHRVHHSDRQVDVTTALRQHPLETVWRYGFQLAGALALGATLPAMAVYLALSVLDAQLEHADVALPARLERALRVLFTTPALHRVHHSRALPDTDRNYGNLFSFWDRLFGTYRAPVAGEVLHFGLEGCDERDRQRTVGLLGLPFRA